MLSCSGCPKVQQSKHLSSHENLLLSELFFFFFGIWDQVSEKGDALKVIPK